MMHGQILVTAYLFVEKSQRMDELVLNDSIDKAARSKIKILSFASGLLPHS